MEYAGFLRRLAASIIDGLFIYMALFMPWFLIFKIFPLERIDRVVVFLDVSPEVMGFLPTLFLFFGGWIYFAVMESSRAQGTFGKQIIGIRVSNMEGRRISFVRASGRFIGKIVSGMVLLIGYVMVAFTDKKQGLHDIMSNTLVVAR